VDCADNAKTILEFDAALAWLSEEAHSEDGRLAALALTSDLGTEAVLESWALIAEGRDILNQGTAPDLSEHLDLTSILARLKAEGAGLNAEELLVVAQEAAAIQRARDALAPLTDLASRLAALAADLVPCPELLDAINRTVGPDGEILDTASPELARLRLEATATRRGLTARLTSLIHSEAFRPLVQDDLITTRSNRFVIPVRASAAGQGRGLVHDWSKTGATAFLEPLEAVEDNNKLGFLKRREKAEIERILRRLSLECREAAPDLLASGRLLTRLDLIMAQARLARAWTASIPEYRAAGGICLKAARHPLLMRRLGPGGMTPLDLTVEPEKPVVVVSGLNTGGKTVALKTLGLNLLLAKAGLHLPVGEGSRLDMPDRLLAVLGDAQDMSSDLSTFSSHVRALNQVLAEAQPGILILLDEIGSGTDPAEGAALGLAVLENLRTSGALVWAATHYQLIKAWAALTPGVVSAAVNAGDAGQPLYGLAYGGPGFSGGLKMARRLGLPESLVARAESYLDDGQRRAMELLSRLDEERTSLKRIREDLAEQNMAMARAEAELREQTRRQAEEFQRRAETQNRDVSETLASVRREFEELKAEMRAASGFKARFSEKRATLEQRLQSARPRAEPVEKPLAEVRTGDRVKVLGRAAVVQAVNPERGEAWVEAGGLNVKVRLTELFPPEAEAGRPRAVNVTVTPARSSGLELHLLGRTVDEALEEVAKELDRAALDGRKMLHIVHGFGTGRLRRGIRSYLERHPRVKSFERAAQNAGGDGVTVVMLE